VGPGPCPPGLGRCHFLDPEEDIRAFEPLLSLLFVPNVLLYCSLRGSLSPGAHRVIVVILILVASLNAIGKLTFGKRICKNALEVKRSMLRLWNQERLEAGNVVRPLPQACVVVVACSSFK